MYRLTIAQSTTNVAPLFGLRQPVESLLIRFALAAARSLRATAACLRVLRLFTTTVTRINCESGNLDSSLRVLALRSTGANGKLNGRARCQFYVMRNWTLSAYLRVPVKSA